MRILGLDPGSVRTGYGLIEKRGPRIIALTQGRISLPATTPLPARLARLALEVGDLVDTWRPDKAVLESTFHGVNSRSLISLAQARGVLLAVLAARGIEIREYTPAEVKTAITGNGRADKEQVSRMVRLLLSLTSETPGSDATDALAVALCYAHRLRMEQVAASSVNGKSLKK